MNKTLLPYPVHLGRGQGCRAALSGNAKMRLRQNVHHLPTGQASCGAQRVLVLTFKPAVKCSADRPQKPCRLCRVQQYFSRKSGQRFRARQSRTSPSFTSTHFRYLLGRDALGNIKASQRMAARRKLGSGGVRRIPLSVPGADTAKELFEGEDDAGGRKEARARNARA